MPPFVARSIDGLEFVGRDRELEILRECLHRLDEGCGSSALIFGEPGIGKSRLAQKILAEAREASRLALRGSCWEGGGAPAYWPWIEALRTCWRQVDPTTVPDHVVGSLADLGIVSLESRRIPDPPPRSVADPERARFRMFDGIAEFLRATSAPRGLVLVLDDLHAADQPTLLMLRFLARELRDAPVCLLGCYRDAQLRQDANLEATLAAIAREAICLPLSGLDEIDVARFIDRAYSRPAPSVVKTAVYRATGGNPLFLDEVVRLLGADDGLYDQTAVRIPISGGIRGAIRERLKPLAVASRRILSVAAIIGHEFDVPLLARASDQPPVSILAAISEATNAAVIVERKDALGRYAFSHGIVRETLYADVPLEERGPAHQRVADAIETSNARDHESHLAQLAYHFAMAAPQGDAAKAISYCRQAGDQATRQFASEEAVTHYNRALQVLGLMGDDEATRSDLLLALGTAHEAMGHFEIARRTFAEAAAIARRCDDADAFVCAALRPGELWARKFIASVCEKSDVAMLEEALTLARDEATRCRVLARLGPALAINGSRARGEACSQEALETARALDSSELLAHALLARHASLLTPSHVETRLAVANEILGLAKELGDTELALRSKFFRFHDLAESGDVIAADLEIARLTPLVAQLRDPFEDWNLTINQATAALFHGDIRASEQLAERAAAIAQRTPGQARDENVGIIQLLQFAMIRREQLRLIDLQDDLRHLVATYPWIVGARALLALLELERGRVDLARRELDVLANDAFAGVAFDVVWLGTMCVVAEICAAVGDSARAALVYERLLPYRARNAVVVGAFWLGSVERYLGLAARCCRRFDDAIYHLQIACLWHERTGGSVGLGHAQIELAEALQERGGAGDHARAATAIESTTAIARALTSQRLDARLSALTTRATRAPLRGAERTDVVHSVDQPSPTRLIRQEGEFWTLAYEGMIVRLKASPGMTCLAHLSRHPGREFHATELLSVVYPAPTTDVVHALGAGPFESAPVHSRQGPASLPTIDADARAAYRARVRELRAEVEEATVARDAVRANALQQEIDAVAHELGRGLGWGGQLRRTGSPGERARVNVTRMLRTALARIAATHDELATHLRTAVRTGTFCSYRPPASATTWEA